MNYACNFINWPTPGGAQKSRKLWGAFLLGVCGLTLAATLLGSFSVASSPGYKTQTLAQDGEGDAYPAAVAIYTQYVIPFIAGSNAPSAAALVTARNVAYKSGSYFRVTYADGSKVDFTITPYPVSIPIQFSKQVASDSTPDVTSAQLAAEDVAKANACGRRGTYVFETGYWGTSWPDSGQDDVVDVVGT